MNTLPAIDQSSQVQFALSQRAEVSIAAHRSIPSSIYGLPEGFYRADLLPDTLASPSSSLEPPSSSFPNDASELEEVNSKEREVLKTAFVPLHYTEGYPALPDGSPFWAIFDFEPESYYKALEAYLAQYENGARSVYLLSSEGIQDYHGLKSHELQEAYHLYRWADRAKAFDLFRVAAWRRQKVEKAIKLQDDHLFEATKLLDRTFIYMQGDEFWDTITPKVAVDFMKQLVVMQRVSAGLPGGAPIDESKLKGEGSQMPTFEIIMQNISREQLSPTGDPTHTFNKDGSVELMHAALQNPEIADLAQQVIIKMNTPQREEGAPAPPLPQAPVKVTRGQI